MDSYDETLRPRFQKPDSFLCEMALVYLCAGESKTLIIQDFVGAGYGQLESAAAVEHAWGQFGLLTEYLKRADEFLVQMATSYLAEGKERMDIVRDFMHSGYWPYDAMAAVRVAEYRRWTK